MAREVPLGKGIAEAREWEMSGVNSIQQANQKRLSKKSTVAPCTALLAKPARTALASKLLSSVQLLVIGSWSPHLSRAWTEKPRLRQDFGAETTNFSAYYKRKHSREPFVLGEHGRFRLQCTTPPSAKSCVLRLSRRSIIFADLIILSGNESIRKNLKVRTQWDQLERHYEPHLRAVLLTIFRTRRRKNKLKLTRSTVVGKAVGPSDRTTRQARGRS